MNLQATPSLFRFFAVAFATSVFQSAPADEKPEDTVIFERGEGFGYRIPALITAANGDVLAFCERRVGLADHAQNDIVLRRSTDDGKTWGDLQVIEDAGGDSLNDPSGIVLDSGEIVLIYQRFPKGFHSVKNAHHEMAEPGYGGPRNTRTFIRRSKDHGATWSETKDISRAARREGAINIASPGRGIQLRKGTNAGRLLFPIYENHSTKEGRNWKTSVLISDDKGATWRAGKTVPPDTMKGAGNENQIVELKDGSILMSSRNQSGDHFRRLTVSHDAGESWEPYRLAEDLVTPQCMASVIRRGDLLVHSLPNSKRGRVNGTILVSRDEGKTWKPVHNITKGGFAYSSLTQLADGAIACLYEANGYKSIRFTRIPESAFETASRPQANPNVLFVLVDDLGWSDLGCYGSPAYETPNIDQLANEGLRFTQFYAGGPVCSPTRASILTGKATARTGITWYLLTEERDRKAGVTPHLPLEEVTLAETFREHGYATGYLGKWHLGYKREHWADRQGFDVAIGGMDLAHAWKDCWPDRAPPPLDRRKDKHTRFFSPHHLTHMENGPEGEYLTDRLTDETIAFITKKRDHPFFAFLSFHTVHTPLQAKPEAIRNQTTRLSKLGLTGNKDPGGRFKRFQNNPNYAAMVQHLDENIGRLLSALRTADLEKDTIVVFTSDNGGKGSVTSNLPLAGAKHDLREGGIRVPCIVRWTNRIPAGSEPDLPSISHDFYPTLLSLTNLPLRPDQHIDGRDLSAHLSDPSQPVEGRRLFWHYPHSRTEAAVRDGDYKLNYFYKSGESKLYNLSDDPGEKNDLANSDPARVKAMKRSLFAWLEETGARFPEDFTPIFEMNRFITLFIFFALGTLSSHAAQKAPNILLIVGEDHGVELSCYGDPVIETPNIDGLADGGVLFENGYVTQSVCSPSRSTIFTGLYPHQNGQLGLATHNYAFFKRWPTTYSLLKAAGYRTGLIGKTHINPKGAVEDFVDFRYQPSSNFAKKNVASYAVESGKFFRDGDEPFFMTVNYPDAHWPLQDGVGGLPTKRADPEKVKVMPYVGHETPRLKGIAENYYNCMLRLDECVGQLLKKLEDSGKAENTLVIFIGDHGAQMARGKVTVYEAGMRVPFIARWPGVIRPKRRSKALVSTIDLLPTFLDTAGIGDGPKNLPGKSLRPLFTGTQNADEFREFLVCERNCDAAHYTFPQRTIRNARYKLIHTLVLGRQDNAAEIYQTNAVSHWAGSLNKKELPGAPKHIQAAYARWLNPPEYQLFDLGEDPHEWNDRADDPDLSAIKKELIAALQNWQKETADPLADPEKLRLLMEENDAVYKAKKRSPKEGWQYLKYLHPDS